MSEEKDLRNLLKETLPSVEMHARRRQKGVDKFRDRGTPHEMAELRFGYLSNLIARIKKAIGE